LREEYNELNIVALKFESNDYHIIPVAPQQERWKIDCSRQASKHSDHLRGRTYFESLRAE